MNKFIILFCITCLFAAVCIIIFNQIQMRKIIRRMEKMSNAAMAGDFKESDFTESMLSHLESKLVHYL